MFQGYVGRFLELGVFFVIEILFFLRSQVINLDFAKGNSCGWNNSNCIGVKKPQANPFIFGHL